MTSTRIVGLVRIVLVAASLAFAGGAAIGAGPVAAGEPELKVRSTIVYQGVERPSGLQFDSRCPGPMVTPPAKASDAATRPIRTRPTIRVLVMVVISFVFAAEPCRCTARSQHRPCSGRLHRQTCLFHTAT